MMRNIQFSRVEHITFYILIILFIVFLSIPEIMRMKLTKSMITLQPPAPGQAFTLNCQDSIESIKQLKQPLHAKLDPVYFIFDPNRISIDSLKMMGISHYTALNWVKYIDRGGKFTRPNDILRIYGMTDSVYANIRDWMIFPMKSKTKKLANHSEVPDKGKDISDTIGRISVIDINQADRESWTQLPGIGDILSERIIKYRNALGGFHDLTQIAEVYGISDETFERIRPLLVCNKPNLGKIPINLVSFKELLRHPYADYEFTRRIITYRERNGYLKDMEAISSIYLTDTMALKKIAPYLSFESNVEDNKDSIP